MQQQGTNRPSLGLSHTATPPTPRTYPRLQVHTSQRHLPIPAHCCVTPNSCCRTIPGTQQQRNGEGKCACAHNGMSPTRKDNKAAFFSERWMQLETILSSEVGQPEKTPGLRASSHLILGVLLSTGQTWETGDSTAEVFPSGVNDFAIKLLYCTRSLGIWGGGTIKVCHMHV